MGAQVLISLPLTPLCLLTDLPAALLHILPHKQAPLTPMLCRDEEEQGLRGPCNALFGPMPAGLPARKEGASPELRLTHGAHPPFT